MISEDQARSAVLKATQLLPADTLAIASALDHFAAADIRARISLPPFDNSAMDGYAVRAADCRGGAPLRVIGEQPAGRDRALRISAGEAVRIFTGAPIPDGADAIVMQEEVSCAGETIQIKGEVKEGDFLRMSGADVAAGQKIIQSGQRLGAPQLALLAAQGLADVLTRPAPRIALISTGDELVAPGNVLQRGEIYESNLILLRALVQKCGARVASTEHCADDLKATENAFRNAAESDAIIVSGGVSVGELDFVKPALRKLEAKLDVWRVAVKPGKPFLFGRLGKCLVFGLPGNPVSAFVTFLLFVRPALLKMAGAAATDLDLIRASARLQTAIANPGNRRHYLRGRLERGNFAPTGRQESHALFSLSQANALLPMEPEETLAEGARVNVITWNHGI
ncbi:MAG TPA: gephyrin-like molybdotransferase Glp [Chthoniobacterales bacterium]|nr:gephyrin-like molybdotransferase Glp [Chthoniobacterales bacterium]